MCAAFASPRSAVDAAVAAQQKLELPVCMGIATGEAELRGSDYFGAVLNRATRRNQADGVMERAPKSLWPKRMHASGESASTIATALDVSRVTVYRVLVWSSTMTASDLTALAR